MESSPVGPLIGSSVVGLVLAGGKGSRLRPITSGRAKAAVPFGGGFRLIDFVLSNFSNSGIRQIGVLTQFENAPLLAHLREHWQSPSSDRRRSVVTALPGTIHRGELWYRGTAHAIYRNIGFIESAGAEDVAVFGADHVYRMDLRPMLDWHRSHGAAATVAALPVPINQARRFGTIEIAPDWRIVGFHEKASNPPEIPGRPGWALASMGNYIFAAETLINALQSDAADVGSSNDFGHDVLPRLIKQHPVYAYDFRTNIVPGELVENNAYWRDVGTVESYYEANMEALPGAARFRLLNPEWPMRPPPSRMPTASNLGSNLLAPVDYRAPRSCVTGSVLGRDVSIGEGATVRDSILMQGCEIGPGANIQRAIIAEGVRLPGGCQIGSSGDGRLYYVSPKSVSAVGGTARTPVLAAA